MKPTDIKEEWSTEGVTEQSAGKIFGPRRDELTGSWTKSHNL
jgi:hypothetical protein